MRPKGWVLVSVVLAIGGTMLPAVAAAAEALVTELELRLERSGVERVNAHLVGHWSDAMLPLHRHTEACDLQAVSLTVRLARSANERAAQAHTDALRAAAGRCTRFVLALSAPQEVARWCASIDSWGIGQTVRELRQRIQAIDADEVLRASRRGKACRAAYLYELQNTRVVLKGTAPAAAKVQER